jgi:hypothetical protein
MHFGLHQSICAWPNKRESGRRSHRSIYEGPLLLKVTGLYSIETDEEEAKRYKNIPVQQKIERKRSDRETAGRALLASNILWF